MQVPQEPSSPSYRWIILLAVCIMSFMLSGTRATIGNFFKTIITDLQWDRGTISFVVAVNLWLSGILQPFAGHVMDRFGAKWLFTCSMFVYGIGVILISFTHSLWYLVLIYGIMVGSATAGASVGLTNALVARWFHQWRALAISVNNVGSALGQLVLVYVSYLLLEAYGWRPSHMYLGAAVLLLAMPMGLLIPRRQAMSGSRASTTGQAHVVHGPLEVERWSQSLRSAPLWQIMGGYFVCGMTVALFYTHLIPFATDRGFSPATAAKAFGLLTGVSVVGSLLGGVAADRLGRKNILALAYALRAGAFAILLYWHHPLALYAFAVIGGLSWLPTPPAVMALTGEIYGMRTIGTLGGVSLLAHQIGGGASVWLAGVLHDLTGSYDISFTLAIVALIGATVVSWSIAERRYSVRYLMPIQQVTGD